MSSAGCLLTAIAFLASFASHAHQQAPIFRSGIVVTAYNFSAVDDDGRPVPDLKAEDLVLRINAKERDSFQMSAH